MVGERIGPRRWDRCFPNLNDAAEGICRACCRRKRGTPGCRCLRIGYAHWEATCCAARFFAHRPPATWKQNSRLLGVSFDHTGNDTDNMNCGLLRPMIFVSIPTARWDRCRPRTGEPGGSCFWELPACSSSWQNPARLGIILRPIRDSSCAAHFRLDCPSGNCCTHAAARGDIRLAHWLRPG